MLLGRAPECDRIDSLLAQARSGSSGVLVIRGEPGIGKTALLDHAAAAAGRARVLRARGVESEVEIAFAGLHELLRPALHALERLPEPQAAALRAAFGLVPAGPAEAPLVGAATLGLLGALAEDGPVLVLLDDVQSLDGPTVSALTFALRRLLADAVTAIAAVRSGTVTALDDAGFDALELSGLAAGPARELVESRAGRPVAEDTAAWLHSETGGNPLALVALAAEAPRLRPGPVGDHVPVSGHIERALGRRLDDLAPGVLAALTVVAVADDEDVAPVLEAGAPLAALEAAEAAGLIELEAGHVAFRHPLVRSVVLARATPAERRAAHRAYGAALAAEDRRAWHAAAGAVAPDEAIAAALAATGAGASGRGGHAAAAAAFALAARLTPDPVLRAQRLQRAAEATWLAGDGERALALLDGATGAEAAHLRGRVLARRGPVPDAVRVLREGAEAVAAQAPGQAAEMLAEAAFASFSGTVAEMDALARRALALAPDDDPRARCLAATAAGAARVLTGDPGAAALLEEAAALAAATPALRDDVRLAASLGVAPAFLRAGPEGYATLDRAIALARERGAVGVLPFALFFAGVAALSGTRWTEAAAAFAEGQRLADEAGLPVDAIACVAGLARLEARRGSPGAAAHAATALERAEAARMGFWAAWALHAQGELALGAGDAAAAVAAFEAKQRLLDEHAFEDPDLSPAPELAEARVRLGDDDGARAAAASALAAARVKGRAWALARATRAQALVAPEEADALFAFALELHAGDSDAYEAARTRLCLGEHLRRAGRRVDARTALRAALDVFDALGAAPWAERAGAELQATGETVRRRDASSLDELTPQELRIALMLAGGSTTRQAAAALYLSPKTVEYHLRHVYLKLGVNSRAALAEAVQSSSAISSAARAAPVPATGR